LLVGGRSVGWFVGWLVVDSFVGSLVGWLVGWWLIRLLVRWLVGWLVGWWLIRLLVVDSFVGVFVSSLNRVQRQQ
jgi:hypothetical protein